MPAVCIRERYKRGYFDRQTWISQGPSEMFVKEKRPCLRGVCKERFDCKRFSHSLLYLKLSSEKYHR